MNFHRESDLAGLADILCRADRHPPVVLLAGQEGSGRRYLLREALDRARRRGERIQYTAIDLEGYEPGTASLEAYARRRLEKRAGEEAAKILERVQLQRKLPIPQVLSVCFLSMALELDLPAAELGEMESLPRVIDRWTRESKLVVHVLDSSGLPATLRAWLLEAAAGNARMILVLSCHPSETSRHTAPAADSVRLELAPLALYELRDEMEARFHPRSFPEEFYQALWDSSRGIPGRAAAHPADAYEPIQTHLAGLPERVGERLRRFLQLAALCGEKAPVGLLVRLAGTPEPERDGFVDLIDTCSDQLDLFEDLGYAQPGFEGELIYQFRSPLLPAIVRERAGDPGLALGLLFFLEQNLPRRSRAVVRLLLHVAAHVDVEAGRERYTQELAWSVGPDETGELTTLVRAQIEQRRLRAEAVLAQVEQGLDHWLPYRSLALVDAIPEIPPHWLGRYQSLRASLLADAGRFQEALDCAAAGQPFATDQPLLAANLWDLMGISENQLGKQEQALDYLQQSRAIRERELPSDHPAVAASLNNLGVVYLGLARFQEAEPLLRRALEIRQRGQGAEHLEVADSLDSLAGLCHQQGRYSEASEMEARALAIRESILGLEHPRVARSLNDLAGLYEAQERYAEAELALARSLAIAEKVLGPDDAGLAGGLGRYAKILRSLHRDSEAEAVEARTNQLRDGRLGS